MHPLGSGNRGRRQDINPFIHSQTTDRDLLDLSIVWHLPSLRQSGWHGCVHQRAFFPSERLRLRDARARQVNVDCGAKQLSRNIARLGLLSIGWCWNSKDDVVDRTKTRHRCPYNGPCRRPHPRFRLESLVWKRLIKKPRTTRI